MSVQAGPPPVLDDTERVKQWYGKTNNVPHRGCCGGALCGEDVSMYPETNDEAAYRHTHRSILPAVFPFLYPIWFANFQTWFPNNHNSRMYMSTASIAWFVSFQAMTVVVYRFWDVESGLLFDTGTLSSFFFMFYLAFNAHAKAWDEFIELNLLASVPVLYNVLALLVMEVGASSGILYQAGNHSCSSSLDMAPGCGSNARRGFAYFVAVFGLFAALYCLAYLWLYVETQSISRAGQAVEANISVHMEGEWPKIMHRAAAMRPRFYRGGKKSRFGSSTMDSSEGRTRSRSVKNTKPESESDDED